jgi:predicted LPLAT superfamily acyltransferase
MDFNFTSLIVGLFPGIAAIIIVMLKGRRISKKIKSEVEVSKATASEKITEAAATLVETNTKEMKRLSEKLANLTVEADNCFIKMGELEVEIANYIKEAIRLKAMVEVLCNQLKADGKQPVCEPYWRTNI